MKTFILLFAFITFAVTPALADQKKVAVVKLLRGQAESVTQGKANKLKAEDWVEDGAVVKTAEKSFVKLIFLDKSSMNIGPNSEMKIENFSGKDSGVIDLVKGKIRSQVTKDYLQMDKDKSKLFIKTPNAVMGIRGTDFMISTNGKNTAAVLFEGEVVFNKLENHSLSNSSALETVVNEGVRMQPGEFSVVEPSRPEPTVPSVLNIQQREALEKNETFEAAAPREPSTSADTAKSVVPEGLTGTAVSNTSGTLNQQVAQVADTTNSNAPKIDVGDAAGFVKGDTVKPANGSFVHIDSGIIIPPAPDSVLDPNTNTFIPSHASGTVSANGDFTPPPSYSISADGNVTTTSANGEVKIIAPPSPVVTVAPAAKAPEVSGGSAPLPFKSAPAQSLPDIPVPGKTGGAGPSNLSTPAAGTTPSAGGTMATSSVSTPSQAEMILEKTPPPSVNTDTTIIVKPQ